MSKKQKNVNCGQVPFRSRLLPQYGNPFQPNCDQNQKIEFTDRKYLKLKRKLEMADLKQRLFHLKQSYKQFTQKPIKVKATKAQTKRIKQQDLEYDLQQQERILSLQLRVNELKRDIKSK